jgi:hypothetical protein
MTDAFAIMLFVSWNFEIGRPSRTTLRNLTYLPQSRKVKITERWQGAEDIFGLEELGARMRVPEAVLRNERWKIKDGGNKKPPSFVPGAVACLVGYDNLHPWQHPADVSQKFRIQFLATGLLSSNSSRLS